MKQSAFLLVIGFILLWGVACSATNTPEATNTPIPTQTEPAIESVPTEEQYTVEIDPADFVAGIDNPYYPRIPGMTYIYEGETEDGLERTVVEVLAEPKVVMGVTTTAVRDTVYLEGEMIEDTIDWFAQDKDGNVWYFGEDVNNYEDGVLVDHDGAWEAGVDGALPGIIMYADPAAHVGVAYHQEFYAGEAEDMAEIISLDEQVSVPNGSFKEVLKTREWTPLEPDVTENKFYARDIGVIQEINPETGEGSFLIDIVSK